MDEPSREHGARRVSDLFLGEEWVIQGEARNLKAVREVTFEIKTRLGRTIIELTAPGDGQITGRHFEFVVPVTRQPAIKPGRYSFVVRAVPESESSSPVSVKGTVELGSSSSS